MEVRLNSQEEVHESRGKGLTRDDGKSAQSEHSLENSLQEFEETEMAKLLCKYGFKLVCMICFRGTKTLTGKPASGADCPTHKGQWKPLRVHQASQLEIRPLPQVEKPNNWNFYLSHNHQESNCRNKMQCWKAHHQTELDVWRAEQAILYPRPCPPSNCRNVPQLCTDMITKNRCERGHKCFRAHSNVELRIWQIKYQRTKEDHKNESQLPEWQKEVEDAVQRAVSQPCIADKLMDIHKMCTKVSSAHKAELGHVVRVAVDTLIQHEVKQREHAVGISRPQQHHHHHTPSDDYMCPFVLSHVDYAGCFKDQLSLLLHDIKNETDLTEPSVASTMTNNIDVGQYDLRTLLFHMKEHTDQFERHLSMDHDLLYCYCIILRQIENQLAHQVYLVPQNDEADGALRVEGRRAYVEEVFLEYSHDFVTKISEKGEYQDQTHTLHKIWESFRTHRQCKKRHDVNKQIYSRLSEREQERVAEEVEKQLRERIKKEKCCQGMLGTYIPALMGIDITTLAVSTSNKSRISQDKAVPGLQSEH